MTLKKKKDISDIMLFEEKKITAELLFSWYFSSIEPVTFMLVWFWIVFVFGLGKEKGFESISARMLLVRLCQWNWDGEGEGG